MNNNLEVAHPHYFWSFVYHSWSKLNLEMLVLEEGGKPEYPEKNLLGEGKNQQQFQPTYVVNVAIGTQPSLVGGEWSHHLHPHSTNK